MFFSAPMCLNEFVPSKHVLNKAFAVRVGVTVASQSVDILDVV